MQDFEFAQAETEFEAVALLSEVAGDAAILAGGTDLISLLQKEILTPRRVVDITRIETMRGISETPDGILIGALSTLEDVADSAVLGRHTGLQQVIDGIRAIQIQQNGTVGGDLCHLPNCWYYRNGYGLLARENGRSLADVGDNRFHAVLGNQGPAKYVSATRLGPALIASGAKVRIAGPTTQDELWLPLEEFYTRPKSESQGTTVLRPGQLLTHVLVPVMSPKTRTASYEVLETEGLDWPLAAAAVNLTMNGGIAESARIVMGHVAPTPWSAPYAAQMLVGHSVSVELADRVGAMAVRDATPLSGNEYKVQLAKTAVKRAILRAVEMPYA